MLNKWKFIYAPPVNVFCKKSSRLMWLISVWKINLQSSQINKSKQSTIKILSPSYPNISFCKNSSRLLWLKSVWKINLQSLQIKKASKALSRYYHLLTPTSYHQHANCHLLQMHHHPHRALMWRVQEGNLCYLPWQTWSARLLSVYGLSRRELFFINHHQIWIG